MDLALRRARADRRPCHQVGDVLRRRHVEEFGPGGEAEIVHGGKHVAGKPEAPVDIEAPVEIGIVDQSLPSDRGARLLEIDPHHDLEAVGQLFPQGGEALGILDGGHGIVDRAGADDDQQAVVGAVQDGVDGVARRHHHPRRGQGARDLAHHLLRRTQLFQFANSKIVGGAQHGSGSCSLGTCRPIKKPPGLAAVRTSWLQFVRLSAILPPPASCRS